MSETNKTSKHGGQRHQNHGSSSPHGQGTEGNQNSSIADTNPQTNLKTQHGIGVPSPTTYTTEPTGTTSTTDQGGQFPIMPIEELPEEFQKMHREFCEHLNRKDPKQARLALRPLIAYYIKLQKEIPVSIEVNYGKLLVLEELEKLENANREEKLKKTPKDN